VFSPEQLVNWLTTWQTAWILPLEMLICYGSIVLLNRYFGAAGLYAYISVAVIGANIQVLKAVQFPFYPEPVALGTVLFASSYLATDVLSEMYGLKAGRKGIWIGFVSFLFFSIMMILTLGYSPLTPEQAGEAMAWNLPYQEHMKALFVPQMGFFIASMCAYLVSQHSDVFLYGVFWRWFPQHLWVRNNGSTLISAFIDNTVFSILAWIILADNPLPFATVFFTYILGTYWMRVVISALDTPFIYLARHFKHPEPVAV
jgi:queuosine precursor transporter